MEQLQCARQRIRRPRGMETAWFPATSFLGCNSKKEKGPHKTKKAQSNMGLKNGPGKCNENIKTHRKGEKISP